MKSVIIDHSRLRAAIVWCSTNINKNFGVSGSDIDYAEKDWAVNTMYSVMHREFIFKNDEDAFRFIVEFL